MLRHIKLLIKHKKNVVPHFYSLYAQLWCKLVYSWWNIGLLSLRQPY